MRRLFGGLVFVTGFLLFCSNESITGAYLGTASYSASDLIGLVLMLLGLFISQLEKKIRDHTEKGYHSYLEQKEARKVSDAEAKEAYQIESVYRAT
ncbi:MAG: hypothetical protein ABIF10_06790, partial [Candidatus Woesearchaeota archaeon]